MRSAIETSNIVTSVETSLVDVEASDCRAAAVKLTEASIVTVQNERLAVGIVLACLRASLLSEVLFAEKISLIGFEIAYGS